MILQFRCRVFKPVQLQLIDSSGLTELPDGSGEGVDFQALVHPVAKVEEFVSHVILLPGLFTLCTCG